MERQRQHYIPGPSSSSMSVSMQPHLINLPPPPPRYAPPVNPQGAVPPPPPGPPPGAGYGVTPGWNPNWGRQPLSNSFPPPPPHPPNLGLSSQSQNQHLVYNRQTGGLAMPPPQHTNDSLPLTSATYIPGGESFGPGVGIPPVFESHFRSGYDTYISALGTDRQRTITAQLHDQATSDYPPYRKDGSVSPASSSRHVPASLKLQDNIHEAVSPGLPTATIHYPQSQTTGQKSDLVKIPSHRHNPSSTSLGGMSPGEATIQWPLDRVLLWLARNGFSKEWQETFKALELQGADFLELGHGANGRGNLGKMHQVVYPQLAKECARSGAIWDHPREREEGKRMRRLIRQIRDGSSHESGVTVHRRRDSQQLSTSFPSDAGSEISPYLGYDPVSASSTASNAEHSPGQPFSLKHPAQGLNQRHNVQMRSVTMPVSGGSESSSIDVSSSELAGWARSDISRNVLSSVGGDHRRQSPSVSSEGGLVASAPSRSYEESLSSGSPSMQTASITHQGLSSSSTTDLSVKYEHSRGNSTDSTAGIGRIVNPTTGRYYESRKQQDGMRPSPHESRQWSAEISSTTSKEHGKGFLNIFKKRPKIADPSHPSPEEQSGESPTSPVNMRQNGTHPFMKPNLNASDMSLAERPSSVCVSDHEKPAARTNSAQKPKKWIFVTSDSWNYRLVDVTDIESIESLRAVICQSQGIPDWTGAHIFVTGPGKTDHDEPLNDTSLALCRRTKCDSLGSLKLFVRGKQSHVGLNRSPRFAGLGLSIPEKVTGSPATGSVQRKPLDEEALNRISPITQQRPSSPILGSRQPTVKAPTTRPASRISHASIGGVASSGSSDNGQHDPEKGDLQVLQQEHKREVERKQVAYHHPNQVPAQQPKKDNYGGTGYRREGVIDFDVPRLSPYEDKKPESLVPQRKPPSAPTESSTLTKVNSLSKRNFDRSHSQPLIQTHGLGIGPVSVRNMNSSAGTLSPGVIPQPGSNDVRDIGHDIHRQETDTNHSTRSTSDDAGNITVSALPEFFSKSVKRYEPPRTVSQSRKSVGPEFEFDEAEVAFQGSSCPQVESDEDSDNGLFAIPLSTSKSQPKEKAAVPASSEALKKAGKPSLTVNTGARSRKTLSVSFLSPSSSPEGFATLPSPLTPGARKVEMNNSSEEKYVLQSPEDEQPPRRDSFAAGDIWASRPPVEGVIDNLDDFFPGVDLDAPYLGAHTSSPPPSPASRVPTEMEERPTDKADVVPHSSQTSHSVPDTISSGESVSKMHEGTHVVPRRTINRSGGLSRMKSIREVAKGANQVSRNRSIATGGNQRSGEILRRKSTKMFGAKIMQISPKPGTRISQLDPIPQNSTSQENSPLRQPTFCIIRGQLIGKGTYGRVYLGINADTGELLAVKQVEINPRLAGQDTDRIKEMVAAMDQEIDTMQHLEHPNIVQYLGCERGEFSISIYLEYISGGSIGSCLRKHGKFEESVVRSLTRQTLSGLAYLHNQGILHRDMKADNILLDLDGTCKISDFGISKKTDNIYGNDSTNSMQGSVFWMAPEVIQSQGKGYSAKVDIWSLGCVVLEMFAGRRPWSKEEAIGAIFKLGSLNQAPPIPEDVSMHISPAALAFMYDCFTVDSRDRPTAETLLTRHPFCEPDPNYKFLDTELYAKIRHVL